MTALTVTVQEWQQLANNKASSLIREEFSKGLSSFLTAPQKAHRGVKAHIDKTLSVNLLRSVSFDRHRGKDINSINGGKKIKENTVMLNYYSFKSL